MLLTAWSAHAPHCLLGSCFLPLDLLCYQYLQLAQLALLAACSSKATGTYCLTTHATYRLTLDHSHYLLVPLAWLLASCSANTHGNFSMHSYLSVTVSLTTCLSHSTNCLQGLCCLPLTRLKLLAAGSANTHRNFSMHSYLSLTACWASWRPAAPGGRRFRRCAQWTRPRMHLCITVTDAIFQQRYHYFFLNLFFLQ